MWDDWDAIERAQMMAAAQDAARAERRAERARKADPEAAAAVAEASNIVWPHPIRATTVDGKQPTNADGSLRDGYWSGGVWMDRPKPEPMRPLDAVRAYIRSLRDHLRDDLDEVPEWER